MWLLSLDKEITLLINHYHSPFFDGIMIFLSKKLVWIPLYVLLIAIIIYKDKQKSILTIAFIALLILLCDQTASGVLKPLFQRLRPCHEALMYPFLHLPDGCGGKYGFVSSHATNSMGLAVFIFLYFFKNKWTTIGIAWAIAISYSRVYLGVHYVGDVLIGMILGIFWAVLMYKSYLIFCSKFIMFIQKNSQN